MSLDGLYVVITLLKYAMTFGLNFEHKDFSGRNSMPKRNFGLKEYHGIECQWFKVTLV